MRYLAIIILGTISGSCLIKLLYLPGGYLVIGLVVSSWAMLAIVIQTVHKTQSKHMVITDRLTKLVENLLIKINPKR